MEVCDYQRRIVVEGHSSVCEGCEQHIGRLYAIQSCAGRELSDKVVIPVKFGHTVCEEDQAAETGKCDVAFIEFGVTGQLESWLGTCYRQPFCGTPNGP
jgi:hypothetical protein